MKLSFATIVLTLAAAVPAAAQTNYYNGSQQQPLPGYSDTRPNQEPIYPPNGVGGYTAQTPGQSPMYSTPNGVGGYGVGGGPTQVPPGYFNRQGR
jgi:hypothetical protein